MSPLRTTVHHAATAVVVVALFYAIPVRTGYDVWGRGVVSALLLAGFALLIRHQVRHHASQLGRLLNIMLAAVAACALSCFALATQRPGEFTGLVTRTDALYFTLVTMTTVGFGDVHPVGQRARILVIIMIGFSVVFIGMAARTITEGLRATRPGSES